MGILDLFYPLDVLRRDTERAQKRLRKLQKEIAESRRSSRGKPRGEENPWEGRSLKRNPR